MKKSNLKKKQRRRRNDQILRLDILKKLNAPDQLDINQNS